MLIPPRKGFEKRQHIGSFLIGIDTLRKTDQYRRPSHVVHIRIAHTASPVHKIHIVEWYNGFYLIGDNRVIKVFYDACHCVHLLLVCRQTKHLAFRRFIPKQFTGSRFGQHDAMCIDQCLFRISRQQRIAKETEEIIFHTIYFEAGFPVIYYRITPRVTSFSIHSAPVGHFRITVGQPFTHQVIAGAIFLVRQHINMLNILYIAAHSELSHYHIGNKQHKHQRNAQSRHVDQCKQLVAVKIGKIGFQSFHRIL